MPSVDICINYYGKPYQTAVTLLTLWKHSATHIARIFVIVEKKQPYDQYESIILLKHLLRNLPVVYFKPKHFYYAGSPELSGLDDPERRYGLKYQYAFEKSDSEYLFLTHNDCLYHDDLLGQMLSKVTSDNVAGVGLIGQCWNCPAFMSRLCDSNRFENYKPTAEESRALVLQHNPPRTNIHLKLIEKGYIHPLPECRLNEYACLINVAEYQKNVHPKGDVLPLGGNWHGTDWGTIWFYEMVNRGYNFINHHFEPAMTHAPFSAMGSGHEADSDFELYKLSEKQARTYLRENAYMDEDIPFTVMVRQIMPYSINIFRRQLSKSFTGVKSVAQLWK